ncbi:MAG: chemotaxis protein CheX [Planctomycetota bacterium]
MTALATAPAPAASILPVNQDLLGAVVQATVKGLAMTGLKAECVGASRVPGRQQGEVTGMIGVHGNVSGFVTINMPRPLAIQAVSGLLGEECDRLCSQVVDGAGEVTNIVVGGVKSTLSKTEWSFSHITVPSVIVGDGYSVAFAPGLEMLDVVFEVQHPELVLVQDRLMHVTLSLLKL